MSVPTVIDTLKKFCSYGLDSVLTQNRNQNSDVVNLTAKWDIQAKFIAKVYTPPPDVISRWILTLLEEELAVILETNLSLSTLGSILQNNDLWPHLSEYKCIPPQQDAEFVAAMEYILDIYQQPYDEKIFSVVSGRKAFSAFKWHKKSITDETWNISLKLMMSTSESAQLAYYALFSLIQEELFIKLNQREPLLTWQKRLSIWLMKWISSLSWIIWIHTIQHLFIKHFL